MSDRTERGVWRHRRRGIALLLAVVTCAMVGVCVLALWRGSMSAERSARLDASITRADALADSALVRATAAMDAGAWRVLGAPGQFATIAALTRRDARWRADIGRTGWESLVVRGTADVRSGARGVMSHAERRSIVPLRVPVPMPDAALTGVSTWTIDAAAVVDIPPAVGAEAECRPAAAVVGVARRAFARAVDSLVLPRIDPDTLRDSLVGAVRFTHGRITRTVRVSGMVVVDSEVVVGADLRVTGVLVVGGSVRSAGGRLDVVGAVVTGDVGGGTSGLGAGDAVRYDACAVRRALGRVASPGPTRTWTTLTLF